MPTDQPEPRSEVYIVGDLRVDVGQQRVLRADRDVELPNLSFRLLVALVQAAEAALITSGCWCSSPALRDTTSTLSATMNTL